MAFAKTRHPEREVALCRLLVLKFKTSLSVAFLLILRRMDPLAEQYLAALDKFESAAPDKILLTYLGSAMSRNDQKALYQLTILQAFLDSRLAPIDTNPATLFLCKRLAEKMVKKGIWPEDVLGQFSKWTPEANADL